MTGKGEVTKDNLPGRRFKKHKKKITTPITVNLAHIHIDKEEDLLMIHNPCNDAEKSTKGKTTSIVFMHTKTVQQGTNRNFTYISKQQH
eukprot:15358377-Ditylum_brightwellii.AAC.2